VTRLAVTFVGSLRIGCSRSSASVIDDESRHPLVPAPSPADNGRVDRAGIMVLNMQQVHFSSGVAHCQYCGEKIAVNRLSAHIAKDHPRPAIGDMSPKLVRKLNR
jgi:hypothetical protein